MSNPKYDQPVFLPEGWLDFAIQEAVEKVDWTEGFWTGLLWLSYEVTGLERYRKAAQRLLPQFQERLDKRIKVSTHDLGFLYSLSCVASFKLTGDETARDTALQASGLLCERFHPVAGVIQAWGDLNDPARQGRMIIDCNLNLLCCSGRQGRAGSRNMPAPQSAI